MNVRVHTRACVSPLSPVRGEWTAAPVTGSQCFPRGGRFTGTRLSDSRNSSFLTLPARSCFPKCWINWQVTCGLFLNCHRHLLPKGLPLPTVPQKFHCATYLLCARPGTQGVALLGGREDVPERVRATVSVHPDSRLPLPTPSSIPGLSWVPHQGLEKEGVSCMHLGEVGVVLGSLPESGVESVQSIPLPSWMLRDQHSRGGREVSPPE